MSYVEWCIWKLDKVSQNLFDVTPWKLTTLTTLLNQNEINLLKLNLDLFDHNWHEFTQNSNI